eukprot:3167137-Amphidinium_carterae.1
MCNLEEDAPKGNASSALSKVKAAKSYINAYKAICQHAAELLRLTTTVPSITVPNVFDSHCRNRSPMILITGCVSVSDWFLGPKPSWSTRFSWHVELQQQLPALASASPTITVIWTAGYSVGDRDARVRWRAGAACFRPTHPGRAETGSTQRGSPLLDLQVQLACWQSWPRAEPSK